MKCDRFFFSGFDQGGPLKFISGSNGSLWFYSHFIDSLLFCRMHLFCLRFANNDSEFMREGFANGTFLVLSRKIMICFISKVYDFRFWYPFFRGHYLIELFSANGRKKLKLYHRLEQLKDIYFIHTKTCTIPNVETNLLLFELLLMHQIYSVLSWNWRLLCKKMRKSNEIVRMIPKEKIWKLYGQRKLTIQAKKEKRIEKKRILSKIWKSICLYCHCKQYEKKWNLQTI